MKLTQEITISISERMHAWMIAIPSVLFISFSARAETGLDIQPQSVTSNCEFSRSQFDALDSKDPKQKAERIKLVLESLQNCHDIYEQRRSAEQNRRGNSQRLELIIGVQNLLDRLSGEDAKAALSDDQVVKLSEVVRLLKILYGKEFLGAMGTISDTEEKLRERFKSAELSTLSGHDSDLTRELSQVLQSLEKAGEEAKKARTNIMGAQFLRRCRASHVFNMAETININEVSLNASPDSDLASITAKRGSGVKKASDGKSDGKSKSTSVANFSDNGKSGEKLVNDENQGQAASILIEQDENAGIEAGRARSGSQAKGLLPGGLVFQPDLLRRTFFDPFFMSVGAVLKQNAFGETYNFTCTGVLVGERTFATAAHCIKDNIDPGSYRVYLPYAGIFRVDAIDWQETKFKVFSPPRKRGTAADIAALKLNSGAPELTRPYLLSNSVPTGPLPAKVYGFGRTGPNENDAGLLRSGHVCTQRCRKEFDSEELICWDYQPTADFNDQHPSNTCFGDSGGPVFYRFPGESRPVLVALTSGGNQENCGAGDHAFNTRISRHQSWLYRMVLAHGHSKPKATKKKRKMMAVPFPIHARFVETVTRRVYTLQVPEVTKGMKTAQEVRVGFNGVFDQTAKFDFSVMRGQTGEPVDDPTAATEVHCTRVTTKAASKNGQSGYCSFDSVAGDIFSVIVESGGGVGDFQVLVSWWEPEAMTGTNTTTK